MSVKVCGCPSSMMCECGWFYPGMTRAEIDAYVQANPRPVVEWPKDMAEVSAKMADATKGLFAPSAEIAEQFKRGILGRKTP